MPNINKTNIPPTYTTTCVTAKKSAPNKAYKADMPKKVNNKLNAAYKILEVKNKYKLATNINIPKKIVKVNNIIYSFSKSKEPELIQ